MYLNLSLSAFWNRERLLELGRDSKSVHPQSSLLTLCFKH